MTCYSCKQEKPIVGKMEFFGPCGEIVRGDVCAECRDLVKRAVAIANRRGPSRKYSESNDTDGRDW